MVIDNQIGNVHTLDFYIPQGFDGVNGLKGDKGDPGPKGEMGSSERIEILNTKTVDAGQLAEVKDDFDGTTHYLTFSIPKQVQQSLILMLIFMKIMVIPVF